MLVSVSGLWAHLRLRGNPNGVRGQPRGDLESYFPHGPLSHLPFPSPPPVPGGGGEGGKGSYSTLLTHPVHILHNPD